ncbi:hypothetical protein [Asanoa iriomotensis]|uniref:Pyrroloquinoline-quinone binding quinoprotein n=1 Tax=Asanoa iriomotensis TaxID=234613 RepID=A0ABQ4C344_9ACTN|nr:hypothetical protein [Asanoa iriomotensis]GIF57197.1 hypothetical protein Air01nite_32920 [Asanoa iriomotensis]
MLEERLRRAFHDQVELTPAGTDRADQIIHRTRRTKRVRKAGVSIASLLAFSLLVGGVLGWQLLRSPRTGYDNSVFSADPTARPKPLVTASIDPDDVASLGLDLRIGDLLWTTDGRRLDLGANGDVERAYRVPAGWIYSSATGVFLQPVDGAPVQVAPEGSRWSVSEDGRRVAVMTDGQLTMAELSREGAQARGVINVPADSAPTAVLGDRVLVAGTAAGTRGYEFVQVAGASGAANPAWNEAVSGVFGTRSDAAVGLAKAGGQQLCLAALRPAGTAMAVDMTTICGFDHPGEDLTHTLSPDGGWLAQPDGDRLSLLSVDNALADFRSTKACEAAGVRSPIWLDARTVVAPYDGGVVRCQTDGVRKLLRAPASAGTDWALVPRLGSLDG